MLIKNAKLIVKDNVTEIKDILIENGKIIKIEDKINAKNHETIDAKENLTIPGGVEVHIHLREPGFEYKETIKTGTSAAAKGGYTTLMPMPNLNPTPDNSETFEKYLEIIKEDAVVNVIPYANITLKSKGQELVDMKELNTKFGIRHFTDDGVGVKENLMMENAMKLSKEIGGMIIAHTEDMNYVKKGASVHEGENAIVNGWIGIPSKAEYKQIERDLELAEKTGAKYHICHMSAIESIEALKKSKEKGVDVSGEVTIHHLLLTENDVINTNFKMNPPLRKIEDRDALIEALKDGSIDFLANDHAPHTKEEKDKSMEDAPFGISNIEVAIPLFYTNFVKSGKFTLEEFKNLISTKPAKRFGIENKGEIKIGYDADIVILDDEEKIIDKNDFITKGKNTPFHGYKVYGNPIFTIVGGDLVWEK